MLMLSMFSGSNKMEPRYACLSEVRATHPQRIWNLYRDYFTFFTFHCAVLQIGRLLALSQLVAVDFSLI